MWQIRTSAEAGARALLDRQHLKGGPLFTLTSLHADQDNSKPGEKPRGKGKASFMRMLSSPKARAPPGGLSGQQDPPSCPPADDSTTAPCHKDAESCKNGAGNNSSKLWSKLWKNRLSSAGSPPKQPKGSPVLGDLFQPIHSGETSPGYMRNASDTHLDTGSDGDGDSDSCYSTPMHACEGSASPNFDGMLDRTLDFGQVSLL